MGTEMMNNKVRKASHAGSWYENDEDELRSEISTYIKKGELDIKKEDIPTGKKIKGIVVPHAGYFFSGNTAGAVFSQINPENYDRLIIIGPTHFEFFRGILLTGYESFDTPFGEIKVDKEINEKLLKMKHFKVATPKVDLKEHSIEMEIPFIKHIYDLKKKDLKIVPMIVGELTLDETYEIAKEMQELYQDERNLFVISSDFCHWGYNFDYIYYDKTKGKIWESIKYYDLMAVKIMNDFEPKAFEDYFDKYENTICGRKPISLLLCMVDALDNTKKANYNFICLKYAQSEQVKSVNDTSVSYAGCALYV
ncbi:MAG: AmmeMemoRadiSam system protein B [archaeon]|nr:AmmeMemoRadiSam system protein B [archaeon]